MMVYRRGAPRVRPYPYHAVLNELGVILGASKKGGAPTLQSQKPPDQAAVAPSDYGEEANSPLFGKSYTWRTLHLGMGLRIEGPDPTHSSRRYRYALNADPSVAFRPGMKGPQITTFTPGTLDATYGVTRFFELGGVLYWLNGPLIIRRDSDAATTVRHTDAQPATDVAVYQPNGAGLLEYAYVGYDTADEMGRFDGTTLTHNATVGFNVNQFAIGGRYLYRAHSENLVNFVDLNSDPWVTANWNAGNLWQIGTKDKAITRLAFTAQGTFVAFKEDGVYTVDPSGEAIKYFPFLRSAPTPDNGSTVGDFMNDLYVRYGGALYKLTTDFQFEAAGPEKYGTVDGPVRGQVTAFAGHDTFHAYAGLYNQDTGDSYLLKYGAFGVDEDGTAQRIDAWHGSISPAFAGKRILTLFKSAIGAPTAHTRLYIGFSDGTIGWFTLPCQPDPAACTQYRYSTDDGELILPDWHAGFPGDNKPLRYFFVGGTNLSADAFATVEYKEDPADVSYVPLVGSFDTTPRERIEFPSATVVQTATFKLVLHNGLDTAGPLLTNFGVRWRLATELQQIYSLSVVAEDGLVSRDGTPLRYGAKRIRDHVKAIADSGEVVPLILPDETIKYVSIIGYSETDVWDGRLGKGRWRAGIQLQVAEDATGGTYGTYGRLDALTYGDLDSMTYADLETL